MNRRSVFAVIGGLLAYLGFGRRGEAAVTPRGADLCFGLKLERAENLSLMLMVFASSWREAEAKAADLAVVSTALRGELQVDSVVLSGGLDDQRRHILAHQADPDMPDSLQQRLRERLAWLNSVDDGTDEPRPLRCFVRKREE